MKNAVAPAFGTGKVKTEPDGTMPPLSLSGNKRKREEANPSNGLGHSKMSTLRTEPSYPPGFAPIPLHLPVPDTHDIGSGGRDSTTKVQRRPFTAAKPTDVVTSTRESMLQVCTLANCSSF